MVKKPRQARASTKAVKEEGVAPPPDSNAKYVNKHTLYCTTCRKLTNQQEMKEDTNGYWYCNNCGG